MKIEIHRFHWKYKEKVGDLLYRNHELLRVTKVGRWSKDKKGQPTRTIKFRVIGKVNLDRQMRQAYIAQNAEEPHA